MRTKTEEKWINERRRRDIVLLSPSSRKRPGTRNKQINERGNERRLAFRRFFSPRTNEYARVPRATDTVASRGRFDLGIELVDAARDEARDGQLAPAEGSVGSGERS